MKQTILFIDDDLNFRELVAGELERCGFNVISAQDGTEALRHLDHASTYPDLIVLDLRMPNVAGTDFLAALNHNAERAKIPVLVMSALMPEEIRKRTSGFPVRGYLSKSYFSLNDLRETILSHIDRPARRRCA